MFRADLLLIIRRINYIWKAIGIVTRYVDWLLAGSGCQQPVDTTHDYTSCSLHTVDPPDDEQQACSKHVEAYYWNKLIEISASCWFMLYGYISLNNVFLKAVPTQDVTSSVSLPSVYCLQDAPFLTDPVWCFSFWHDRSRRSSPSLSSATFQNFPNISYLQKYA